MKFKYAISIHLVLTVALLCAGCGDSDEQSADPAHWLARADAAFRAGDESARRAKAAGEGGTDERTVDLWADAVEAWTEAARCYRNVFRLEDPVEERRETRALLAFRIGRAMSNAARKRPAARASEGLAQEALMWFGQAEHIQAPMRQVQYERALLYESEVGCVRDLERARMAYEAYLAAVGSAEGISHAEQTRVERARKRAEELAPPEGD